MTARDRFRAACAAIAVAGALAGCTGSTTHRGSGPSSTACELITQDVIEVANFNHRVLPMTKANGVGKHGTSACAWGDDPDPRHISSNFLLLVIWTPSAVKALHVSAKSYVRTSTYPCAAKEVRELGSTSGIGRYVAYCAAAHGHAPSGGWLRGDKVYTLEVGTPPIDFGTTAQRAAEFESVARAIAKHIDS